MRAAGAVPVGMAIMTSHAHYTNPGEPVISAEIVIGRVRPSCQPTTRLIRKTARLLYRWLEDFKRELHTSSWRGQSLVLVVLS